MNQQGRNRRELILKEGIGVWGAPPDELVRITREESARMAAVIKAAGIKPD